MQMLAGDVENYLSKFNENGKLNAEEIFLYGGPEDSVNGICVCWMVSSGAITYAAEQRCNLLVCHEAVTYYDYPVWAGNYESAGPWESDKKRLELIKRHQMTVLRVHSTVDPTHVGPALWKAVGLPEPFFRGWAYSCHTVKAITVRQLAEKVKAGLGLEHIRITGDPERVVNKVGTIWGGGGLDRNMHIWHTHLLPKGAEVIIVGETNEFAQRCALDSGIALLEAGHAGSEDPGLEQLARDVACQFPDTKVVFRAQEPAWTIL